jgi:hypothetical protein
MTPKQVVIGTQIVKAIFDAQGRRNYDVADVLKYASRVSNLISDGDGCELATQIIKSMVSIRPEIGVVMDDEEEDD